MRRTWFRKVLAETVVVHTRDDQSFRGWLTGVYKHELVLERATYLGPEGETQLQGHVGIPREAVAFVQVLPMTEVKVQKPYVPKTLPDPRPAKLA